jgi:hypothetical protein
MGLRPGVSAGASAVLLGLLLWFGAELVTGAGHTGLAERIMGALQALWPLLVVLSCYRTQFPGQAPVTGLLGARHAQRGPPACRAPPPAMQAPAMKAAASQRWDLSAIQTGEGNPGQEAYSPGGAAPQPHALTAAQR